LEHRITSVLNVDEIAATDGTSPVALTKQHASKAWVAFDETTTTEEYGSFNLSSLTDNGSGNTTVTVTNAFSASTDYCVVMHSNGYSATNDTDGRQDYGLLDRTASAVTKKCYVSGQSGYTDSVYNDVQFHGDLA